MNYSNVTLKKRYEAPTLQVFAIRQSVSLLAGSGMGNSVDGDADAKSAPAFIDDEPQSNNVW